MVTIQVKRNVRLPVEKSILLRVARITQDATKVPENVDVSIVISDDDLLHELNLNYRHIDAPTDVLSFASNEIDPDTAIRYLGDVVISLPRAQEQASAEGHPLAEELQLLVVHGMLHLFGFDHEETRDKKKMWAIQDEILKQLGLSLTSPI
jgi:probable rRNA maturation factor